MGGYQSGGNCTTPGDCVDPSCSPCYPEGGCLSTCTSSAANWVDDSTTCPGSSFGTLGREPSASSMTNEGHKTSHLLVICREPPSPPSPPPPVAVANCLTTAESGTSACNCLTTAESGTYACISNYDLQTYGSTSRPTPFYPSCEACTEKGLVYAWTHARTTLWTAAMVQTLYSGVSKTCTLPTGTGPWNQGPSCSSAG